MKKLQVTLTGTSPMLMHSDKLANPLDPATQAHKEVSGKRNKTEEDQIWLSRSEWESGIYRGSKDQVIIPSLNLRAVLIRGGALNKLGTHIKRAVHFDMGDNDLIYDGPQTPNAMWKDGRFVDVRAVKVGPAKIMRCRPLFNEWMLSFDIMFDPEAISLPELKMCWENAGNYVGLGDFRPLFGRFSCEFK